MFPLSRWGEGRDEFLATLSKHKKLKVKVELTYIGVSRIESWRVGGLATPVTIQIIFSRIRRSLRPTLGEMIILRAGVGCEGGHGDGSEREREE